MRAVVGIWRWRRNGLRRRTDLVEAWTALVAVALIVFAAPAVGWIVGSTADEALQRSVQAQHDTRHRVTATVLTKVAAPPLDPDPETSTARDSGSRVTARWAAPDGSRRSGPVKANLRSPEPGDRFRLWTDDRGRPATRPLDSATAGSHAVLAGVAAGAMSAGLVEGARRLVVWRLVRARYEAWDSEWAKAGPDWGRTGTGS
ncbi:hypothetical protein DSC45_33805 [Streptomyces sp. YIM 130001]|uniref:Rv1733c family protein n=1 Tax=Streptomyces sp. YIM 130001 TaxID=2259644 RepID=UPI000E650573|nr:hypothetical protein [Streptomyces sp. YIM 130001]RII08058.1 hypothetical protein DSC45_33805 [Streptomyces sp. YIM 130001]